MHRDPKAVANASAYFVQFELDLRKGKKKCRKNLLCRGIMWNDVLHDIYQCIDNEKGLKITEPLFTREARRSRRECELEVDLVKHGKDVAMRSLDLSQKIVRLDDDLHNMDKDDFEKYMYDHRVWLRKRIDEWVRTQRNNDR